MDRVALEGSETSGPVGEAAPNPDPNETFTVSVYLVDRSGAPSAQDVGNEFARAFGLEVESADEASRRVQLTGTVRELEQAFGVELQQRSLGGKSFITYDGPIRVPRELAPSLTAVLGLDRRPLAEPRMST